MDRDALDRVIEKCTGGARVALVGLGGAGYILIRSLKESKLIFARRKSQIAIEVCYRIHKQNPESWVFWVHASNASRFQDGYKEIADHMRIPGRDDPNTSTLPIVCR